MTDEKKFLDYEGLSSYHKKAKALYDETYAKKEDVKDMDLSGYVKSEDADKVYAKKSDVVDQETLKKVIAEAQHMKKEVVEALPSENDGVENVIYLVKKAEGGETNFFDEHLLIDGKWELIGNTETKVDLSNYPTKDEMTGAIAEAKPDIGVISEDDIDDLFRPLPEGYVPYPANGLYPSPDNYLRVWAGEEMIAEIENPQSIEDDAYSEKGVTRVEIPDSVTSIGNYAFSENQLTSAIIPNSVTSIMWGAIKKNKITSISIPTSITEIPYDFASDNPLNSIVIPESVTKIQGFSFHDCQLTSVTIPDSVTSIGASAFSMNSLKTVSISRKTQFYKDSSSKRSFPSTANIIYRD